jgi:flagellar biosynthetic protein FliO
MDFVRQMAAAGAVLGLLGATLWWLRRKGIAGVMPARRTGGRKLESLERLALGPQHTLHLVRLGETALLLASSPSGCTLLESLPHHQIEARSENPAEAAQ